MARTWCYVAGLGLATWGAALGAAAGEPLLVLAKVNPGQWQVREIGSADAAKTLCLADPARVLQFAHGDAACTRTVIDNGATKLTVRYSCPGKGQGMSVLTVSTPSVFRLQTQGMAGGAPFDHDYEAKRLGDCPGASPAPATGPTATPTGAH